MTLYMIRHGQTEANERRLFCGRTDVGLSEKGKKELICYRKEGLYPPVDAGYTSGLLRTAGTLELAYGSALPQVVLPGLREYDFGDFEMKSHGMLAGFPDYQAWLEDREGLVCCPGGESRRAFEGRVWNAFQGMLQDIYARGLSSACAVTHGGVIFTVMRRLFPDEADRCCWPPACGLGYRLAFHKMQPISYAEIASA